MPDSGIWTERAKEAIEQDVEKKKKQAVGALQYIFTKAKQKPIYREVTQQVRALLAAKHDPRE